MLSTPCNVWSSEGLYLLAQMPKSSGDAFEMLLATKLTGTVRPKGHPNENGQGFISPKKRDIAAKDRGECSLTIYRISIYQVHQQFPFLKYKWINDTWKETQDPASQVRF